VFVSVGDPVGAGLVGSLNRPGADVTGVTSQSSDVVAKRLQVLDELLPGKQTIAVLMNPDTPSTALARSIASFGSMRVESFVLANV
jgi:putative tryptophan/tyrosine transport system substrate-binding protein